MRRILFAVTLAIPAIPAILAAPAAAQSLASAGFTAAPALASTGSTTEGSRHATRSLTGVTVHHGDRGDWGRDGRDYQGRGRDGNFGGYYADLRDGYDINRGWASDSYNDWWHDRPDRAFPRWLSSNQDCQRQWWSGGGWRC